MKTWLLAERGEPRNVPPLVVTSPHQMQLSGEKWLPFGRQHAMVPGAETTLCGQRAHAWPSFWDLAFDPGHEKSCPECASTSMSVTSRGAAAAVPEQT